MQRFFGSGHRFNPPSLPLPLVAHQHNPFHGSLRSPLQFVVKAKCVVNATGPFSDGIRKMDDPKVQNIIKGAAGVHVVLPDHYSPDNCGLIVPKTSDGRVLFFLPWEGGTISGTTDSGTEISMEPSPTDEEVGFIIEEVRMYKKCKRVARRTKATTMAR
jgi:glycerol-3-phosphate dehydrogenase